MTIADKLTYLANTKTQIKNAIVAKGVEVADTDPFRSYAEKIAAITGGGGGSATVNKSNFVLMGNPTYENGTLKDITAADYGLIPSLTLQSGSWEFEVGFKTGSDVSGEQYILATRRGWDTATSNNRYGIGVALYDGQFNFFVGGPSSWYVDVLYDTPQANTNYKMKLVHNGSGEYTGYIATNGGEYVQLFQQNSSQIGDVTFVDNLIGCYAYSGGLKSAFKGEIYPKDFVFRNNGEVIYQCVTTSTVADGDWV